MVRFIAIAIMLISGSSLAFAAAATVLDVFDGDTLNVEIQGEKHKVKLYGIDAPESGQEGYIISRRFLLSHVLDTPLELKSMGTDVFGRTLAILSREGQKMSINASMVANGYAWVKPSECNATVCADFMKLQSHAKRFRLGIWSGFDLVPPWEFAEKQQR